MSASSNSSEEFLQWGLDSLYNSYRKVLLKELITKVTIKSISSVFVFLFNDRPIRKVEVVGIISAIVRRERKVMFHVDDGTASIQCVKYCDSDEVPFPFLESGQLASVKATLILLETNTSPYGLMLQVKRLDPVVDPNVEILHWICAMR